MTEKCLQDEGRKRIRVNCSPGAPQAPRGEAWQPALLCQGPPAPLQDPHWDPHAADPRSKCTRPHTLGGGEWCVTHRTPGLIPAIPGLPRTPHAGRPGLAKTLKVVKQATGEPLGR